MIKKDVCFSAAPSHGLAKVQLIKTAPVLHPHPVQFQKLLPLVKGYLSTSFSSLHFKVFKCTLEVE